MKPLIRRTVLLTCLLGSNAFAQDIADILDRHNEARGGLDHLNAITSVRVAGTMAMMGGHHGHGGGNGGPRAPLRAEYRIDMGAMRMEYEFQGKVGVQAYDGESGWSIQPFMGNNDPEKMAGSLLDNVRRQADFLGPLVNPDQKGHTVEFLGKEDVQGTATYKLKVTRAGGEVDYYFLDAEHYLPIRKTSKAQLQGRTIETTTTIGDYKPVDGVMFPHSLTVEFPGGGQTTVYDTIELNVDIDESRFAMPTAVQG